MVAELSVKLELMVDNASYKMVAEFAVKFVDLIRLVLLKI